MLNSYDSYELAALGALLLGGDIETLVSRLELDYFESARHRAIFAAARDSITQHRLLDPIILVDRLRSIGMLEIAGGPVYLATLSDQIPSDANFDFYAEKLHDRWIQKQAAQIGATLRESAKSGRPIAETISDAEAALSSLSVGQTIKKPFINTLEDKIAADEARSPGELLGLRLARFRELSEKLDGVQSGLYLVAAPANVGKTAFLANIALDVLDAESESAVLYFSLDDDTGTIIDRLLTITTRQELKQMSCSMQDEERRRLLALASINIVRQSPRDPQLAKAKAKAVEKLKSLASSGRLDVKDADTFHRATDLEAYIRARVCSGRKMVVVIDALYNLKLTEDSGDVRAENIDRANFLKRLAGRYSIPVLCSAEVRKRSANGKSEPLGLDDLMESGKYAYNSSVVLMLSPDDPDLFFSNKRKDGRDAAPDVLPPCLVVDFVKNKLSDFRGRLAISYWRASSYMETEGPFKQSKEKTAKPSKGVFNGLD
jgi:replicative DNA helicase